MRWTASTLLETWERGLGEGPLARAAALLLPDEPNNAWSCALGRANESLLDLSRRVLGLSSVHCVVDCPSCGGQLETSIALGELREWLSAESAPPPVHRIIADGYVVSTRNATLADLREASNASDLAAGRRILLGRCILSAERGGGELPPDSLPAEVLEAVSREMGERDRAADLQIGLRCADCGYEFSRGLDLAAHAWQALEVAAKRILGQIMTLARAFGWTESQVLALSPTRRAAYLRMLAESNDEFAR